MELSDDLKELMGIMPPSEPQSTYKDEFTPDVVEKVVLNMKGAQGVYSPVTNTIAAIPPKSNEDIEQELDSQFPNPKFYGRGSPAREEIAAHMRTNADWRYKSTIAHEKEHKRQYEQPGSYSSREDLDIWRDSQVWKDLKEYGYSDRELPREIMAFMAGSNTSDSGGTLQSPHAAWGQLTDRQKLWILSNKERMLTDQDYLDNLSSSIPIQRIKHIGSDVLGVVLQLSDGLKELIGLSPPNKAKVGAGDTEKPSEPLPAQQDTFWSDLKSKWHAEAAQRQASISEIKQKEFGDKLPATIKNLEKALSTKEMDGTLRRILRTEYRDLSGQDYGVEGWKPWVKPK